MKEVKKSEGVIRVNKVKKERKKIVRYFDKEPREMTRTMDGEIIYFEMQWDKSSHIKLSIVA